MILLAAVAAGLAWFLWAGPPAARRLVAPGRPRDRLRAVGARVLPVTAVGVSAGAGAVAGGGAGAAIGLSAGLAVLTAGVVLRAHRRRSAAAARAAEVADACQLLAGLLRVGHVPAGALRVAARDAPVLAEAAAMLRVGGEVPPVLRSLARVPGRAGLAELAAAWEVAGATGASLTATLDALADRLASRQGVSRVVAAELSAPRATGRLLAVLPVAGLALGYALGGDPLSFLTGSWPGRASLVAGVALGCAGVVWTERIADTEEG